MTSVNSRDLSAHIVDLMLQVRNDGEIIEIMEEGQVVARLVPAYIPVMASTSHTLEDTSQAASDLELERLITEISRYLPEQVDAVEAIREIRR